MPPRNFDVITSMDALKALVDKLLAEDKKIGFDLETGYLGNPRAKGSLMIDWDQQFISGFSITNSKNWARYVPVAHDFGDNLPEQATWELMKPVLETLPSVAHNARFEIRNLRALERKGRGPRIDLNVVDDSILQSYVLALYARHGLKYLVKEVFSYDQPELASLFPEAKKKDLDALRFSILDLRDPKVIEYACEDAVWTLALDEQFGPVIEEHQRTPVYQMEMAILPVLADMEDAGHAVDWDAMQAAHVIGLPFEEQMKVSAKSLLSSMAGEDLSSLNLASAPQMREVLYSKIGLRTNRKTDKGEMSTDAQALEALSREHPAVKKVLEVREVHNLTNRLGKWQSEYAGMHDSRIHASFNQVVVPSGRFSANDPAIQQCPKEWRWSIFPRVDAWNDEHWAVVRERAEPGKEYWDGNFRDFLNAGPGSYLLTFDWSQVELRCLAGMSQEPALLKAFNEDADVHTLTAAMMLGLTEENVTKRDRAIGKTMNFALLYGMGEESMAERLALTFAEAEALYAQYFSAFTKVTEWMAQQKAFGKEYGYVETAFKRRITIWGFRSDNRSLQSQGERLCVNAPVQGSAADMMKAAMLRCARALKARGWWQSHVRMVNNIHDSLVFEVDNSLHPDEVRALLQDCVVWDVVGIDGTVFPKIVADWELGQTWGSSRKWTDEPVEFIDGAWQIVAAPPPPVVQVGAEPGELVVEVDHKPSREALIAFTEVLSGSPGATVVTLKTPQGTAVLSNYTTALGPEQQGLISMVLGGARVYRPTHIDTDAFAEGMVL